MSIRNELCRPSNSIKMLFFGYYIAFWDMINHIKWLRPIYCLHYRFMCFMNWDDDEELDERDKRMKIIIHKGMEQIGGCITEIQSLSGSRILIDLGHNLPENGKQVEDEYESPDALARLLDGIDAIFYTHYHGDHIAFYASVPDSIPQYIGPIAREVMINFETSIAEGRSSEQMKEDAKAKLDSLEKMRTYKAGECVTIGDICITPYSVCHSAVDSYMMLVECDGERALHTGDFRGHGFQSKTLFPVLNKYIVPRGIDHLICEGTSLGRESGSSMYSCEP